MGVFKETPRYAARLSYPGVELVRKADGESVFFQPGDDARAAMIGLGLEDEETAAPLTPSDSMFDSGAAEYFT